MKNRVEVYELENKEYGVREIDGTGRMIRDMGISCYTEVQAKSYLRIFEMMIGLIPDKKLIMSGKRINGKTSVKLGDIKI